MDRRQCLRIAASSLLGFGIACDRGSDAMASRTARTVSYADLYAFFEQQDEVRSQRDSKENGGRHRVKSPELCGTNVGLASAYPPNRLRRDDYDADPLNSVCFAHTGGDGCHFSFVLQDGKWSEHSPVVMTYPPIDFKSSNVIVGENLFEFLCLGIGTGYFVLENLALGQDREKFIASYPEKGQFRNGIPDDKKQALRELAARFQLQPWEKTSVGPRLAELRKRYLPTLKFDRTQ